MTTYRQHRATAKYRGLQHTLTEQDYYSLLQDQCVYCGGAGGGIDRLDPMRGYLLDNCVSACKRCNARKAIYEHLGVDASIEKAVELAHRNEVPPPSQREWKMAGAYKYETKT